MKSTIKIYLRSRKKYVFHEIDIDPDVEEFVQSKKWVIIRYYKGESLRTYFRFFENGKYTDLHRYLTGASKRFQEVDHINGNTLDNRRCNLRIVTHQKNMQNRGPIRGKYIKGVRKTKTGKFEARCMVNHVLYIAKYFDTEKEAAKAYNGLAMAFGDGFTRLNEL
jgi:hypothetical protein